MNGLVCCVCLVDTDYISDIYGQSWVSITKGRTRSLAEFISKLYLFEGIQKFAA